MPVYGYRCSRGHHFELQQRITDPALNRCLECDAPATRVFYPVGIIFKGQGFYKTDSRGGSTSETSGKPEPTKTETAKTETAKTETAKTETAKTETSSTPDGSAKSTPPPAKAKEEK
jgi:putative FmdB family regulatory protein